MSETYAGGIYVVATSDGQKTEYWAAAVPRADAIREVQDQLPTGWKASTITDRRLTPDQVAALKMRLNSVRKL